MMQDVQRGSGRSFQFRLSTLLLFTLLSCLVLAMVIQGQMLRRQFRNELLSLRSELLSLRIDQAEEIVNTHLALVEERLQSSSLMDSVLGGEEDRDRHGRLRIKTKWNFSFDDRSDIQSIRGEIIECLRPLFFLERRWEHARWNWDVEHTVDFKEDKNHGVISLTVQYYQGGL